VKHEVKHDGSRLIVRAKGAIVCALVLDKGAVVEVKKAQ
jgi:hypothetical protein